jgi:hypothetical protein
MIETIEELFRRQTIAWPQLAAGLKGLAAAQTRRMRVGGCDVYLRLIPHRLASSTAATDPDSVAKRPCFLCEANMPAEEEGTPFGDYLIIYCNPFPVIERHLTIAHREHRPQRIAGQLENMLKLAAALPGYFVFYNGPECGASAPDHLHFQAGSRGLFPIERDSAKLPNAAPAGYSRNVFIFRDRNESSIANQLNKVLDLLGQSTSFGVEPMVNLAIHCDSGQWTAYLFPRSKHRPRAYYTGELTISPAALDMCGVFVTPRPLDFETITAADIEAIYREVTLPDDQFRRVANALEKLT